MFININSFLQEKMQSIFLVVQREKEKVKEKQDCSTYLNFLKEASKKRKKTLSFHSCSFSSVCPLPIPLPFLSFPFHIGSFLFFCYFLSFSLETSIPSPLNLQTFFQTKKLLTHRSVRKIFRR